MLEVFPRQPPALQTSTAERAQPHQPSQPRRHRQPPALQTSTMQIRMIFPRKSCKISNKTWQRFLWVVCQGPSQPRRHRQPPALQTSTMPIRMIFPRKSCKKSNKTWQRAAGPNTPTASDPKNTNSERAPVFVLLYCFLWLKLVTQI